MLFFEYFVASMFGLFIGSFLNVVAIRYNTGLGIHGRSECLSCAKTLSWYELIPVFSFLALRGKCRGCGSKISWQYPIVELASAILFVLVYMQGATLFVTAYLLTVLSILLVITVYDIRHTIIPDGLVYAFIGLSGLKLVIDYFVFNQTVSLWHVAAGPILFFPFALLWFLSRGTWMGFGDAKLAWGIGWFLGLVKGTSAIIMGFWVGALISLLLLALRKMLAKYPISIGTINLSALSMKSEIPFAPFLILGTVLVLFFDWGALEITDIFVSLFV